MNVAYLAEKFAVLHPIVNAPMAGAAGGRLAAAVSEAGGFGMVGMGNDVSEEWLDRELSIPASGDRPWGLGVMAWSLPGQLDRLHRALRYRPAMVSVSFGDPRPALGPIRDAGAVCAMQVGSEDDLRAALEYGVDIVVVRGSEGGGHGRNDVATLPLLQLALETVPGPVLAAGGIATARGVAATLAAGAAGAWIGTRFTTVQESLMPETAKRAIADAAINDTVYTRAFDIAQQVPWPADFGGRAIANAFSDSWEGRMDELERAVREDPKITEEMLRARQTGDTATAPVYAGEGAGLTGSGSTAAEVIAELSDFRPLLAEAAAAWS